MALYGLARLGVGQLWASEGQKPAVCSGSLRHFKEPLPDLGTGANPAHHAGFGSTERRRSRTYPAAGYATSPVLKTG